MRDEFIYQECGACGCLELLDRPTNLSAYYPPDYYSMQLGGLGFWLRFILYPEMSRYWSGRRNMAGYVLTRGRQRPSVLEWLGRHGATVGKRLLEIGSGAGLLLFRLRDLGFSDLVGIDPFVARDIRYPGNLRILKRQITEIDGSFDYVVLNHSFEHMDAPLEVLRQVRRLLAPKGRVMITTPIAQTFAWREYGVDWVQLDAPRHLFVHSTKSVQLLAEKAGLIVTDIVFDSSAFQFWGSEQYRAGIPLYGARSYLRSTRNSMFTSAQVRAFQARASALNSVADGDSASFYLRSDTDGGE